ncbi:MAG: maltose alpha-D-glucosyltransferase [Candidatus Dormibacteraeota bacterium]|nr:maltose alpha-D-glucosyltransferase [Candidatus Dormibacteraeota bacterium]
MEVDQDSTWYKDAIIYELHARAFSDSNSDGIGDFPGLIEKLEYIQSLGVTALWLLPFYPSPLKDDGYDIADYYDVNPSYGRPGDVRRLVREAHKRGLKVITELVCNHTSDQHPWFQRARRSRPGTSTRDFYVWSDNDQRYSEARIIFKDFETSNWTWDPVAQAYYWHRFYSHQPDLNFDNPRVKEAIFKVVDHWLGMGVDGLRLDAIPYLYEREGTNCENLPESHEFLKQLRAHVDANYSNRMLLAEANQWPEDAVVYLGEGTGDECHMAFHFPVMPRLFMALRMEDRFPIIDILDQTPPIPPTAQWAMFLRNHDELTLEMVTDEERDYMYRAYTRDPEARINLGIRRRLAPLLNNNRRRIELMNGLLFSLPGTPVIYYGDEIGMGDNIYLGDRDGVRTPMQWSGDRNAGFSTANRQRLYLPVITDPEYHYEAINVEAQEANQQSLLHWMKRLIALRKRHPAFGRGSVEFLHPNNRKVLAFVRRHGKEQILIVANLSRFAQFAEIDMSSYEGLIPVELFGRTEFPRIGELPYLVTLGPHAFYWFSLEPARVELSHNGRAPELSLADEELEHVLPQYLVGQRWYGAKSRRIKEVHVLDSVPMAEAQVKLVEALFDEGDPKMFVLPLCQDGQGQVVDAVSQASFNHELLDAMTHRRRFRGTRGDILALPTSELGRLRAEGDELVPRPSDAEQSNNSVIFGERLIMKLYRHLEEGLNPDLEISRFLTESGFNNVAPVAGALLYRWDPEHSATLAMLQAYVPNQGDGWSHALNELTGGDGVAIECYLPWANLLGRRTAEMHISLASSTSNPDFMPEPTSMLDARSIYQSIRSLLSPVMELLRQRLPTLVGPTRDDAAAVLKAEERLHEHLRALLSRPISAKRIRCHGDFHLGQVLFTGGDFIVIDFEGEPGRPLRERRLKRWALKDVAGMLRSYDYAAAASGVGFADEWARRASEAFLDAYFETAAGAFFLPSSLGEQEAVLNAMLIEKALYELRYELDHRPEWVHIPLRGLRELALK